MSKISGQSIIEILIATAVVSVLLVSLLILGTNSLKTTTYARNLDQAIEYSNQASDWLRNMKTSAGWAIFSTTIDEDTSGGLVTYCLISDPLPPDAASFRTLNNGSCSSADFIPGTIFQREVTFDMTTLTSGTITATITTNWEENTTRTAIIYLTLTQWK